MECSGWQMAPSCWGGSVSESSTRAGASDFSHSGKQIQDVALMKCAGVVSALLDGKLFYFFFWVLLHSFSLGPTSLSSVMKLHAEEIYQFSELLNSENCVLQMRIHCISGCFHNSWILCCVLGGFPALWTGGEGTGCCGTHCSARNPKSGFGSRLCKVQGLVRSCCQ